MTKRQDGKETRRRLLHAACKVFGEKGYRNATVADICSRAGANVAAVNYYFTDKACLYADAWRYAFEQFENQVFLELGDGSPEEQLRELITVLIKNFATEGGSGHFIRLYLTELVNPTGLIREDWLELIGPRRQKLHDIIRGIIGPDTDALDLALCELSIVNQCRTLLTVKQTDLEFFLDRPLDRTLLKRMADHINDFSLAGIKAIGKRKTS